MSFGSRYVAPLLMLCPSRGRPGNIDQLIRAYRETMTFGHSQLLVAVDDDDPWLPEYRNIADKWRNEEWIEFVYGPRLRLGGTLNKLATERAADHYAIGFLGDDHRPKTPQWDNHFLLALEAIGYGFVYGNDLFQGANLPTQVAVTSDVIEILGHFVPPACVHLFFDNAWLELGNRLSKITYLESVVIEHMHPFARKGEWDPQYAEVNSPEMYAHDRQAFNAWCDDVLPEAVPRIKEYCELVQEEIRKAGRAD